MLLRKPTKQAHLRDEGESSPNKKCLVATENKSNCFTDHFCINVPDAILEEAKNINATEAILTSLEVDVSYLSTTCASETVGVFRPSNKHEMVKYGIPKQLSKAFERLYHENDRLKQVTYQALGEYRDLYCVSDRDFTDLITLHVLNHAMLTRSLIMSNKRKLEAAEGTISDELIEETRDQGLSRPKVLVLLPFRKSAYKFVHSMIKAIFGDEKPFVMNLKKFEEEFGDDGNRIHKERKVSEEYKELMSGNVDDCFRLGIGIAKKCLKLTVPFESADILICSPLGLRMIIGGEEDKKREYDFLSSIEVLVLGMAHVFPMQNWEHVIDIFQTVNTIPKKIETNISRIRQWAIKNQSKFYRQTVVMSRINIAEVYALFPQMCFNYAGTVNLIWRPTSTLEKVSVSALIELHRFGSNDLNPEDQSDKRLDYFMQNILPLIEQGTIVFVSSYFDFVRLRNCLKRENQDFVQVHEYAEKGKVAKARYQFFTGDKKLMILTERFYFFYRYRMKGVKSVMFYQAPLDPQFFNEILNFTNANCENAVCRMLFSKFDLLRLQNIFGFDAGNEIINSNDEVISL